MVAVALSRLHYKDVRGLPFLRAGMHYFSRRDSMIVHSAHITGEKQALDRAAGGEIYLRHARAENVRSTHKPKRQLGAELLRFADSRNLKILHAGFRLIEGVKRQRRLMLG